MHVDRLQHLLQTLLEVQARDEKEGHSHFFMGTWYQKVSDPCGTTACALGWEAQTEYALERGLFLNKSLGRVSYEIDTVSSEGYSAATDYFNFSNHLIAESLFCPSAYIKIDDSDSLIMIKHVIDRINYILTIGERYYLEEVKEDLTEWCKLPGGLYFSQSCAEQV